MNPIIDPVDPVAVAATEAIHRGDTAGLGRPLADHPQLATAAVATAGPDGSARTLLHVAIDWPGHHPDVAATIAVLVAGAPMSTPG